MTAGETFSCPECGGPLKADGKSLTVVCPFCGASVIVPESLRPKPAPSTMDVLREAAARAAVEAAASPPPAQKARPSSAISRFGLLAAICIFVIGYAFLSKRGSGSDPSVLSQISGLAATPTAAAIQRPLSITLPRQVSYAGIVFTLTGGDIDNQDQSSDPPVNLKDQAFARLDVRLENTTRENIYLDPALFRLRLADGVDYTLDSNTILRQDFRAPGPQAAGATSLIFPVPPESDWSGAVLTIAAPGSEPAGLPLSGEMPAAAYPASLQLPANPQADAQGLTYQIQRVALDLDNGTHRAESGQRFLKLEMQISNTTHQYGANISSSNFRLIVDGIPGEPQDAPIEVVDYQTTTTGEVVFQIPAAATSAIFQVGDVTSSLNEFGQIPLDLTK